MASTNAAGQIRHRTDSETLEILERLNQGEALEELAVVGVGNPQRDPHHYAAYQSTLSLALARALASLAARVEEPEEAGKTSATTKKAAKKK